MNWIFKLMLQELIDKLKDFFSGSELKDIKEPFVINSKTPTYTIKDLFSEQVHIKEIPSSEELVKNIYHKIITPEDQIRNLAYYKWLDAGQPNGRDIEFWTEAEKEYLGFSASLEHKY